MMAMHATLVQSYKNCECKNSPIQLGILKDGFNDQSYFDKWIKELVDETKFEIVCKLIKPAYVGDRVLDTAINRLQTCKQKYIDEHN